MVDWFKVWWSWLTLDLTGRFAFRSALIWMVSIQEPRAVGGLGWSSCDGQNCKSCEIHLVEVQASRNDWKGSEFLHFRYLKFLVTVLFGVSFIEASKSSQQNLRFMVFSEERTFKTWVMMRCSLILPRIPCTWTNRQGKIDRLKLKGILLSGRIIRNL